MIIFGYLLVALVLFSFLRYPKQGVLIALFLKPTIDMFWWAKAQGLTSPLLITAVLVPAAGVFGISRINANKQSIPLDNVIKLYLVSFAGLTLLKIVATPQFTMNSIDLFARVASVTLFYFVGRFYFQTARDRLVLTTVLLASVTLPFVFTLGQGALGINLTHFADVYAAAGQGVNTGEISAYYLAGRHGLVRISGVYEGVYELAFMGTIAVLIGYSLITSKGNILRLWQLAVILAGAYLLYFTYSRSAWVTTVMAFGLYFLQRRSFSKIIIMIAVIAIMYFMIQNVQYRFEDELGFFTGQKEFGTFGYGRGNKWTWLMEGFQRQEFVYKLIGNFGIGNPENQFLGTMFWYGYIGLFIFVSLLITLTISLLRSLRLIRNTHTVDANVQLIMGSFVICSYWFAGLGNHFSLQISIQWIIWLWVGIIAFESKKNAIAVKRVNQERYGLENKY